jgi:hypothetical protein
MNFRKIMMIILTRNADGMYDGGIFGLLPIRQLQHEAIDSKIGNFKNFRIKIAGITICGNCHEAVSCNFIYTEADLRPTSISSPARPLCERFEFRGLL